MPDPLHTRIITAISDGLFVRGAYSEYGTDDEPGQWQRVDGHINLTALADAVIRELRLHVVTVGHFQTVIKGSYPTPLEDM